MSGLSFCGPLGIGPFNPATVFDLTPCFEDVISILITSLSFIIYFSVSYSIPNSIPLKSRVMKKSLQFTTTLSALRFLFSLTILILNIIRFGYICYHNLAGSSIYYQGALSAPPFSAILESMLAVTLSIMTLHVSRFLVQDSISFLLTTIWIFIWLFDLIRIRTMFSLANLKNVGAFMIAGSTAKQNNFPIYLAFGVILVEFGLICVLGIPIHSWSTIPKTSSLSPEQHASFISRIFFFWAWPLLRRGWSGTLEIKDIFDLTQGMASGNLQSIYEHSLSIERKIMENNEKNFLSSLAGGLVNFFVCIFQFFKSAYQLLLVVVDMPFKKRDATRAEKKEEQDPEVRKQENVKAMFIVKVLFRSFGWEYLGAGILRLGIILLTFITPQLMQNLLKFIESNGSSARAIGIEPQPKDLGVAIVVSMIAIMLLNLALSSMFTWICDMATYKARSALMTEIYRKALRLKNPMSAGEVVNRFSSDTGAVTRAFAFLHLVWSAPIEIVVALVLLYGVLGPAAFMALGTSIIIGLVSYLMVPYLVRKSEKMMAINDKRMNLISGTFSFAQTIKMYGWEKLFAKKITNARNDQLDELGGVMLVSAFIGGLVSSAVSLIVLSTLAVYAVTAPADKPLDLPRIFVGMSLLSALQSPLNTLSGAYSQILQLSVSFRRLAQILCADEIQDSDFTRPSAESHFLISFRKAHFTTFPETPRVEPVPILRNINLDIPAKGLTAIVGPTGCGKSSLLSAISGGTLQMEPGGLFIKCNSKMGIVPQKPWIYNGTVRDNILFFADYEADWYKTVIDACALKPDFESLKGKDMAQLTDGGNLSGGQRQRIALARAVYSLEAEVFLFDDPLSAVDARVSAHIFEQVMSRSGILGTKTRIVSTNRLDLLPQFDHVIVMSNGTVIGQGPYQELMRTGSPDVRSFLSTKYEQHDPPKNDQNRQSQIISIENPQQQAHTSRILDQVSGSYDTFSRIPDSPLRQYNKVGSLAQGKSTLERLKQKRMSGSIIRQRRAPTTHEEAISGTLKRLPKVPEYQTSADIRTTAFADVIDDAEVDDEEEDRRNIEESEKYRVVQDEMQHRGRMPYNLYLYYIRNCSYILAGIAIFLLFADLGLDSWNQLLLKQWGESNVGKSNSAKQNLFFLGIFAAGSIGDTILAIVLDLVAIRFMALAASRKMHEDALLSTLAAPITFYHANPAGRIINRFSNDIMSLDRTIPSNILSLINSLLAAVLTTALACIASPFIVVIVAIIGVIYWFLINFFIKSVRELRRLVLTSQSPTFQFLKESMDGIITIRGFGKEDLCQVKMQALIDTNSKVFYSTFAASSWLATNIQLLSLILIVPVLSIAIATKNGDSGLLTIAISNSLSVSSTLQGIVQAYISMEISLVSIERIKEYIDREPEDKYRFEKKPAIIPGPQWPSAGKIQFINYSTSYSTDPDGPLVLKSLNLMIKAGQRVAVVGRTGAGKSSMVLALFQLLESRSGTIYIDDMDISAVPVDMIRARMAIIPQQAMLYPGTVRDNLDPALVYTDKELWNSLGMVGLAPLVNNLPSSGTGKSPLDERFPGEKLSMGQMQLFCLCRAILLQSKIIVLDEPTSNLDIETDSMIQRLIRTIFRGCTVITIAHRIATILDYDAVLVMDQGEVKEYGHPRTLLANPTSSFAILANGINE